MVSSIPWYTIVKIPWYFGAVHVPWYMYHMVHVPPQKNHGIFNMVQYRPTVVIFDKEKSPYLAEVI